MNPDLRSLVAAALLAGAGAAAVPPAAALEIIDNAAEPPARETWQLREVWRIGGDDEDVLLGQIGVAISGPGGEVYALDSQLAQVQVFAADGRHLRTLGREGEGPGEFRQPIGMFLATDGTLAVLQPFPGRLVHLDAQSGEARGQWTLGRDDPQAGGFGMLQHARERGGIRVISAGLSSFDTAAREMRSTRYLALLDADGREGVRLAEQATTTALGRTVQRDELEGYFAGDRGLWDLAPDGHVYLAPRYDTYLIQVLDGRGAVVREIRRPHEARLRTTEEKANVHEAMTMNINGQTTTIETRLQDRARCIERLQVLDDGTLWVAGSHGAARWPEAGERTFDVHDAAGRLRREVTVAVPAGGEGDRLLLLDDGRFLLVKGLERMAITVGGGGGAAVLQERAGDVELELICYEVVR